METVPHDDALDPRPQRTRVTRPFIVAFAALAAVAVVPLWSVRYPPMVDLPQHAAQVFVWQHFSDPAYGFAETYTLRFFSPYLVGYALVRCAAWVAPLDVAIKLVLSFLIVALPLAMALLFARSGSDRWLSLLGFPLAYGFAFYWGFLNYLIAVPLGLLFVAAGFDHRRSPSFRSAFFLALFAVVIYFSHALVFAFAVPVVGLLMLGAATDRKRAVLQALALVPPGAAIAAWTLWRRGDDPTMQVPQVWSEAPWTRLAHLPSILLGGGREQGVWALGGVGLLAVALVCGRLGRRPWWLWLPCLAALLAFAAAPNRALGTWFVYPRFAIFLAVFALGLLVPAASPLRRRLGRGAVVAFALLWLAFLTVSFAAYDAEARRFDELLEAMAPHRRTLGLIFEPGYDQLTGLPVFGHFVMWYQATRGGLAEYSFALAFPQVVHYREDRRPLSRPALSLRPQDFDWRRDGGFDYFVVRAKRDLGPWLFRGAPFEVPLVVSSGDWWLYHRPAPLRSD